MNQIVLLKWESHRKDLTSLPQLTNLSGCRDPPLPHPLPKGRLRLFENNILLDNRKSTCCSNREQGSEVVASDGAFRLLSGMSVNQSRLVQSNLWQETTSLWDTPAAHLYASQHHKQLDRGGVGSGGLDLPQLSGEKYVSIFPLSVAETTKQSLLYFPHYCSLVWIPPLVSFPPVHTLKRLPLECVPLLPRDRCTTGLHGHRAQRPHRVLTSLSWVEDQPRNSWSDFKHF